MRTYCEAGGNNAVIADLAVDLVKRTESANLAEMSHVSLACSPDEARQRLKRFEQLGFGEVLLVSHAGVIEDIEWTRDFIEATYQPSHNIQVMKIVPGLCRNSCIEDGSWRVVPFTSGLMFARNHYCLAGCA
jgi:hypothetical protein